MSLVLKLDLETPPTLKLASDVEIRPIPPSKPHQAAMYLRISIFAIQMIEVENICLSLCFWKGE
eukprot:scaffold608535_cov59-Attheya_sp.AAC.3